MNYHVKLLSEFIKLIDDPWIWAFIWVVIFDIATGFSKSLVAKATNNKTNSTKGLTGLIKHLIVLFLILTIYPFLRTIGFDAPANTIIIFYIIVYAVSILENIGQMGIPVPKQIKKHLTKLQDDYDKEDFK